MTMSRPTRREDFGVAIVCALPLEFNAAALAFDEIWEGQDFGKSLGDHNTYTLGRIGQHNVVLALLDVGKVEAAGATTSLRHSFTAVKLAFLCGICGGVPNPKPDVEVLLGDVVIADHVVEYDYGRQYPDGFVRNTAKGGSGTQSKEVTSFLRHLKMDHQIDRLHRRIPEAIGNLQQKSAASGRPSKYVCPGDDADILFQADYFHRHQSQSQCACGSDNGDICNEAKTASCSDLKCDLGYQIPSRRFDILEQRKLGAQGNKANISEPGPRVFYGNIGSGDTVMKSGQHRDKVAQEHDIVAFEMEGAGVWNAIPCLIVKAVCDYADSHKSKEWQSFAAVAAASVTKLLLGEYVYAMPPAAEGPTMSATKTTEESGPAFLVPYPQNPDFVDRSEVFDRLRDLYGHAGIGKNTRTRLALHGLGGVGKTQIALAYCYWFQERFPDAHVFWVHASNIDRFRQAFTEIARECNISGHETTGDILTLVKKWLENRKAGRWLLVIDNADDLEVFFPTGQSSIDAKTSGQKSEAENRVGRFIPNCNHGSILITTRNKQAGLRLAPGKNSIIEISRMTELETESLLRALIENEDISSQETSLLSNRLEHLPLAIAQAASFINENFISINEYIELLDQSDLSLVERLSEPFEAFGRDSETPHALTETWMISFNQIKQQSPLAGDVLSFVSLLDRQGIPKQLIWDYCYDRLEELSSSEVPFDEGNVGLQVTKVLGTLLAFSFISRAGDDLFDMHRLVQLTTHKRLLDEKSMTWYARNAVMTMSRSYPESDDENREKCQKYLPHALAVLKHAELDEREVQIQAAYIKCEVARHLESQGFYEDAVRNQKEALEIRVELLGQEDKDTLFSMERLSEAYRRQGLYDEALKILPELLKIRQRLLGKEHQDTLNANFILAKTYNEQGDYSKAEQLHLQRLEVEKRTLGHEHHDVLSTMHDVAALYLRTNRLEESEELCLRLMDAEAWGPAHKRDTTRILSQVYYGQDRLEEAHKLISKLIEQETVLLGENNKSTLRSLGVLAKIRGAQGCQVEKAQIFGRVLEIKRRVWGNTNPITLRGVEILARALGDIGKLDDAEELRQEHFDRTLLVHGHGHAETLFSMHEMAYLWWKIGRLEDAAKLFEECLEGRKRILGHGHHNTLITMRMLALSWREMGRLEDAAKLFEECLEGRKRILGHRHEKTLITMYDLGRSWREMGRVEDAVELMRECVDGRKQTLGEDHPDTKDAIENLAEYEERLEHSGGKGNDASVPDNDPTDGSSDDSGKECDAPVVQGSDEDSDSDSGGGSGVLLTESP